MSIGRFERAAFLVCASILVLFYGYGTATFGWFPGALIDRAVEQATAVMGPPSYLQPRVYEETGARTLRSEAIAPGFTLISTHAPEWDWRTGLKLIDQAGRTVHEWPVDSERMLDSPAVFGRPGDVEVHGSHLFDNGDVLVTISNVGIARMDACGNVLWDLRNGAHHSISRADDGTFWIPTTTPAVEPTSERYEGGYPGLDRPVHHDRLVRISGEGEPLDTISALDVLYDNDLVRYLTKYRPYYAGDLTHVNDVEPLSASMADEYPLFDAGDLLVSLRSSDLVLVVDPETENVKWHVSDPLVHQHDPDFIGDGWIGIFDNRTDGTDRGEMLGGSRIVSIQPHTDSLRVVFPARFSDPFYSPVLGKWQLLENGNMLLTEGVTGRVVEVTSDGRTVWEWIGEHYDESRSAEVTEGTRYRLTPEQVESWPCSMAGSLDGVVDEDRAVAEASR